MTDKRQETTRILRSRDDVQAAIRTLSMWQASPEQPVQVIIKPYHKNRSRSQNSRYWKLLGVISIHVGETADALHDIYKRAFLSGILKRDDEGYREMSAALKRLSLSGQHEDAKIVGFHLLQKLSTAELDTKQFGEYMDLIEADACTRIEGFEFNYG